MSHHCKFCGKAFRKSDHRSQHEAAVHKAELRRRDERDRYLHRAPFGTGLSGYMGLSASMAEIAAMLPIARLR